MDEREARHRAAEAERLVSDPLFVEALEAIRLNTLVALSTVDATNVAAVLRLQAKAAVVYEIVLELQGIIAAGPAPEPAE
jgi:hypothetical protein